MVTVSRSSRSAGFTLIELMIVVAIIAVLAMIALPSYQEHVVKTRRSVAQACLMEAGQFMERYYTTNLTYEDAPPPECSETGNSTHYDQAFVGKPSATTYTVRTTPKGAQASREKYCGTMTLDQSGACLLYTSPSPRD